MHAIAATEIFAVWEEMIKDNGGDKVNLAEASEINSVACSRFLSQQK